VRRDAIGGKALRHVLDGALIVVEVELHSGGAFVNFNGPIAAFRASAKAGFCNRFRA
jgi:hypothetical protein